MTLALVIYVSAFVWLVVLPLTLTLLGIRRVRRVDGQPQPGSVGPNLDHSREQRELAAVAHPSWQSISTR